LIDTIRFLIPILMWDYELLREKTVRTLRIDQNDVEMNERNGVGLIMFDFHGFDVKLPDSWAYGVSAKLSRDEWLYDEKECSPWLNRKSTPYVIFEFSVPKVLYGHNLESCDWNDCVDACYKVREAFKTQYGLDLPDLDGWYPTRVDTCANYILPSKDAVLKWLTYASKFDYPRKPRFPQSDSLYFASRHSTFKAYCKGSEFKAHDSKRIADELQRKQLQKKADCILRIESEHRGLIKQLSEDIVCGKAKRKDMEIKHLSLFRSFAEKERDVLSAELVSVGRSFAMTDTRLLAACCLVLLYRRRVVEKRISKLFWKIRDWEEREEFFIPRFHGYVNLFELVKVFDLREEMKKACDKFLIKFETKVMKSADVYALLLQRLGSRAAGFYYGMFVNLVTQGS
jgi:hypothetical protein